MPRPTFLVAEPEPNEALSVRKLVLETAKFNVITAHHTQEALDIIHLFPKISAAILVMAREINCELIAQSIKSGNAEIVVIALSPQIAGHCAKADHILSSHEPEQLVSLVRSLFGDPREKATSQITGRT